ncbi:hypothetical protein B0H10DRAFT_2208792 [Mycena sp. CBHHK59/15]|nr:hypothetical protein B0H10DRAFT_2208792 [Mycena sp. CBHHK59/15]
MSDSFVDANIDPQILAMDPVAQMLQMLRASAPGDGAIAPGPMSPAVNGSTGDDNMDQDIPGTPTAFNFAPLGMSSMAAFGGMVKHQINLTDKSTVAFDQFCQNRSAEERTVIMFAHVLKLLDIIRKNEKAEQWVITSTLSKKINSYAQAFMYSPKITAYRGLNMAEHLLKAMHETHLAELPPEEETTHCEMVLSRIRDKGTHYRNIFKTTIKISLEPNSETQNIAALANKLLAGTKLKATAQFYVRLAFIRFVMTQYPWLTEETFWLQVDEFIEQNRKDCKTPEELDVFYNFIYQKDVKTHGDPADTPYKTVEFNASARSWQAILRKHSANIQPNPKNTQLLAQAAAAATVSSSNKKHRLEEVENDEPEVGAGGNIS